MKLSLKMRKEYVRYAKVFPFSEMLDFKLPSKWYRRTVGGLEILFGLALATIPSHKIKNTANVGLVFLMILAAYSHVMVGDPFDRCAPALVFFFMLTGRLVVWYQTSRREELEKTAATQNGNGLKRE
ncbi:novel acetylcholine receptor chaperone isoform X2 [Maniola hyperantus]|uniref:novel acetylcholine receptor chaperone isoform X2 n=1 Tax=Aphantopus hyperantus TaxID=2795564 RepID=UPI003747EB85